VAFESFSNASDDPGRKKRLLVGYVGATVVIASVLVAGAVFGREIKKQVFEEEVDVKLVKRAEAPPPPPPPKPVPKVNVAAKAAPAAPLGNDSAPPKEIPKELPKEGDPNAPKEGVTHYDGAGSSKGVVGGKGQSPAVAKVEPPTPPPTPSAAPAPEEPIAIAVEQETAPVAISKNLPAYPEAARKQGVEAIVVVSFFVEVDGSVSHVRIVRGHELFDEVALQSVRAWKFTAGTVAGVPKRMKRVVKIPFKLRTQ
jgi:periplasmic protein TonB